MLIIGKENIAFGLQVRDALKRCPNCISNFFVEDNNSKCEISSCSVKIIRGAFNENYDFLFSWRKLCLQLPSIEQKGIFSVTSLVGISILLSANNQVMPKMCPKNPSFPTELAILNRLFPGELYRVALKNKQKTMEKETWTAIVKILAKFLEGIEIDTERITQLQSFINE